MGLPVSALILFQVLVGSDAATDASRFKAENPSAAYSDRRQAYEQLIRSNPSDHSLYAEYASLLIAKSDYPAALEWITKGLAVAPSDPGLRLRDGIVLHALGRHEAS